MKLSDLRKKLSRRRQESPRVYTEKRGKVDVEYTMSSSSFDGRQSSLTDYSTDISGIKVEKHDTIFIGIDPASEEGARWS